MDILKDTGSMKDMCGPPPANTPSSKGQGAFI